MTIGEKVRKLREFKGFSLPLLAEKAGISKGYLWQLENKKKNPSIEILEKIAKALDLTIGEILGYKTVGKLLEVIEEISNDLDDFLKSRRVKGEPVPVEDIIMLTKIRLRSNKPINIDDWEYIYRSIKMATSSEK